MPEDDLFTMSPGMIPFALIAAVLAVAVILGGDGWPAWVYRLSI